MNFPLHKKPSGQDRFYVATPVGADLKSTGLHAPAADKKYVAEATRRRRRILQSRILSCIIGNSS